MTNDTNPARRNPYDGALVTGGWLAVVLGGLLAFVGNNVGRSADSTAQFRAAALGDANWAAATGGPYVLMWFGIVLAVLGALALIAGLAVRAARN